ncbi:MAG: efflux RND transporter periplasmic adaptor subunit [Verrucomicrobia bacterium]|nr:efflux RND transporter periplasmic adaptor subunit [Verrucomicrobiota bacterium]
MKLVPMGEGGAAGQAAKTKTMYRSTMNPNEVSDKPGKDSMGMDMIPFEAAEGPSSSVPGLAVVSITPESRQLMGLKLGTVQKRSLDREVRTSARIVANETRLWRVTTKIAGWVDKLFVNYTGQEVKKGEPLLTLYSPELVSAQEEYLIALRGRQQMAASSDPNAVTSADALLASARRRLELWDISADQIERLGKTRQVEKFLTLYAPASGVVTEKNILAGQQITAGDPLMVIADLSVVWGDADIYQSDLPYVKVGMPLEISLPYWPGKTFQGKVIFVSPTLNTETRTLRARLEIPNPELLLKPGMFADARLHYQLGDRLAVPEPAIMFSGKRTYAFKDAGDGHLIPTEIKIGSRGDGWYELLDGLKEGDQIVVSGNFLVDSESSLKAALEAMAGGGGAAAGSSAAPAAGEHAGHQH